MMLACYFMGIKAAGFPPEACGNEAAVLMFFSDIKRRH